MHTMLSPNDVDVGRDVTRLAPTRIFGDNGVQHLSTSVMAATFRGDLIHSYLSQGAYHAKVSHSCLEHFLASS